MTEAQAINALKKLAKTWPDSLWLFAANGTLNVMKKTPEGERAIIPDGEGMDHNFVIASIDIESDGGDW
jgi:hypothetical protein